MKAYYSDTFVLPLPEHHRFPMAKYRLLRERLVDEGVVSADDLHVPEPISWDDLRLVHDAAYVEAVRNGTLAADAQRRVGFPWSPAVAARVLERDRVAGRIAVVDCDVHQDNGTAAIFRDDPAVFTFSMHGEKNYPFRKEVGDLDVTFADGATDDEYLTALTLHLPRVLDGHRPDCVFYLAGADPYEGDRLGRLKLSIAGLRERDRFVFNSCRSRNIPVCVPMSGGYAPDIDAIVAIHSNTIREAVNACQSAFVC